MDWLLVLIVAAVVLIAVMLLLRWWLVRKRLHNPETAELLSGRPVDAPSGRGLSASALAAVHAAMRQRGKATAPPLRRSDDDPGDASLSDQ